MMAKAGDRILWCPPLPDYEMRVFENLGSRPANIHYCPTSVYPHPVTRQMLDPMALGTCRYCRQPLS